MKYLGFPLPELEIIYPICAKGCRKIRDTEFLEDIRHSNDFVYAVMDQLLVSCPAAPPTRPFKGKEHLVDIETKLIFALYLRLKAEER